MTPCVAQNMCWSHLNTYGDVEKSVQHNVWVTSKNQDLGLFPLSFLFYTILIFFNTHYHLYNYKTLRLYKQ